MTDKADSDKQCCGCGGCNKEQPNTTPRIVQGSIAPIDISKINWGAFKDLRD